MAPKKNAFKHRARENIDVHGVQQILKISLPQGLNREDQFMCADIEQAEEDVVEQRVAHHAADEVGVAQRVGVRAAQQRVHLPEQRTRKGRALGGGHQRGN